jgi:cold shock CspA family protein
LPSDRQRWYIETSKVLYLTKNYDKCIKCIERGFEKAKDFSPDNQFWLLRRKYLAMAELGKYENAIEGLKQLINTKSDWFLFKDLSEIFFRDNNKEMALSNACIASILPGKIDYKVSLFSYMAINLVQQKQAPMHHWIVNQIKEKNNWKISSLNQESNPRQENSGYSAKQLFEFWIDQLKISGRLKKGKITKILHQGNKGDGFIEQANGQLVYFKSTDIIGNVRHLSEGCKVFFLKKSKQFKGKTSFQAYGILLADNDEKIRGIDKLIVI